MTELAIGVGEIGVVEEAEAPPQFVDLVPGITVSTAVPHEADLFHRSLIPEGSAVTIRATPELLHILATTSAFHKNFDIRTRRYSFPDRYVAVPVEALWDTTQGRLPVSTLELGPDFVLYEPLFNDDGTLRRAGSSVYVAHRTLNTLLGITPEVSRKSAKKKAPEVAVVPPAEQGVPVQAGFTGAGFEVPQQVGVFNDPSESRQGGGMSRRRPR